MEISAQDREELRQYLLGQMVEVDLSQVEERLMSESDLYEELLILEDEIIDRYVRGEMSEADRASFESYFLQSPEHRQKLRFARALSKYVDRAASEVSNLEPEAVASAPGVLKSDTASRIHLPVKPRRFSFWPFQSPILNYSLASLLIIAIGGVAWIALKSFRPARPGRVFEATLVPSGVIREGGEIQTITVPPGTDTLRLQLILPPEQYSGYRIELIASDGRSVLTRDQLIATEISGKKALNIDIPAKSLPRDSYRIKLSARSTEAYEETASYNFRISHT